jgi:hypothetical protein
MRGYPSQSKTTELNPDPLMSKAEQGRLLTIKGKIKDFGAQNCRTFLLIPPETHSKKTSRIPTETLKSYVPASSNSPNQHQNLRMCHTFNIPISCFALAFSFIE